MTARTSFARDRIRVLLLEGIHPRAIEAFHGAGYTQVEPLGHALSGDALAEALEDVHILGIRSRTQLTEDILRRAPRLFAVGCFCIGTNQVALDVARERAVPVFNAPYSNTRSVAELILAETILLLRRIPEKNALAHRGVWAKTARGAHEARGKTLGIVGYGNIGAQLGVLAEGLGMNVLVHDVVTKLQMGNARQVPSLDALLAASDVVTLHVPQTPETRNLMDADRLARMKDGAVLLNASRGNVVDIDALAAELASGRLGGAAIDVFPTEPPSNDDPFESPLRPFDNVILTPHVGGSTQEAQENIAVEVASKLVRYSDNGSTLGSVNFPEVALPEHEGKHRLLHVHRNVPGVLGNINRVLYEQGINISGQYLRTDEAIGYVVIDLDPDHGELARDALRDVEHTLRCRVLF